MRPRREALLTTFADPSTFPSVFETPAGETPETPAAETLAVQTPGTQAPAAQTAGTEAVDAAAPTEAAELKSVELEATTELESAELDTDDLETAEFETADEDSAEAAPAVALAQTFAELGLAAELVRVLTREGITTPFEIQSATMPDALAGRDVRGRGQPGPGKPRAFGLPLLTRIAKSGRA